MTSGPASPGRSSRPAKSYADFNRVRAQDQLAGLGVYYDAWTGGDFGRAAALLAPGLAVEVPVNEYPDAGSFAAALKSFGSLATRTELLAAMSAGQQGMLLYDMDVPGLGTLRVAEHLTVDDGQITRIRQIHDTAALRAAGFVGDVASPRRPSPIRTSARAAR